MEKCDAALDELVQNFTVIKEDLTRWKKSKMAKRIRQRKSRLFLSIDKQNTFKMESKDCSPLFGK